MPGTKKSYFHATPLATNSTPSMKRCKSNGGGRSLAIGYRGRLAESQ
jgi:hypothetical protein